MAYTPLLLQEIFISTASFANQNGMKQKNKKQLP